MAVDFSSLKACTELREVHIGQAATSSAAMRSLLKRFAELATPGRGAPVILAALARLGTTACDWIDGELRIEISGDATKTVIAISSSLGAGFAEKVFPDTTFKVPVDEFKKFVVRASTQLLEPLTVLQNDMIIVLAVAAEVRKSTVPPPNNEIDPSSMFKLPKAQPTPSVPMPVPALAIPQKKA